MFDYVILYYFIVLYLLCWERRADPQRHDSLRRHHRGNSLLCETRNTGIQEYRNTGIQEYKNTGIQIKSSPVPLPGAWE